MTRLGLWGARGDRRGLAVQGSDFALHMQPDKVMGFDTRSIGWTPLDCDWRDFNREALTLRQANGTGRLIAEPWLKDLDVVWGCETFYQDNFPLWAKTAGVATIQHCNPEFYRFERETQLPRPTVTLVPTSWRLEHMPGARVLPCPVNRKRCKYVPRPRGDGVLTFLHVVGLRAVEDRNGTETLLEALRYVERPCNLLIRSQANVKIKPGQCGKVKVDTDIQDRENYWTLYDDADVLIMPRRYGGQCLPFNEAMSCGLPVLMTDVSPQNKWLPEELLVPAGLKGELRTQAGMIDIWEADAQALAWAMDALSADLDNVASLSRRADKWAHSMSWEALKPRYDEVIEMAAEMR